MASPERGTRRLLAGALAIALLGMALPSRLHAQAPDDMVLTKHNLSVSGRGSIRALTETRICVFCHTPHSGAPLSPLWNKDLEPRIYTVYASPTLQSGPLPQPFGPTKLCLSCHDGTIAMGAVLNPAGGISMSGGDTIPPGTLSNFGLDLSGHHPVSFAYHSALPNVQLATSPPPDLVYGGSDQVHCITCHDPHNDSFGKFLLKDNRYSALCIRCHQMAGWPGSKHATSTASVVGLLPRPPKTWPAYTQLNEWGCEVCHTPHFAPTAEELLNFTEAPPSPYSCTTEGCHGAGSPPFHGSGTTTGGGASVQVPGVGTTDVAQQSRKLSAHRMTAGATRMPLRSRAARTGVRTVTCADCHNPHQVNDLKAEAPYVSGMLAGATGIDRFGGDVRSVAYEYEVCFKCHSDNTPDINYVPRVVSVTNTRLAFDPTNPSYHPVVAMGKNLSIPSIPSSLEPAMSPAQMIYCSTCHADDEGGARGPHGSSYRPILRERYETNDNTPESYANYALCYRCHNRTNILSDASFQKKRVAKTASGGGHSGHLAAGVPCSACHDPHGVNAMSARGTGSHTHLINFDTRTVRANGNRVPVFNDTGSFSGSCTLVEPCHGVPHDNLSYP